VDTILARLSEIFSIQFKRPGLELTGDMKTGDLEGWDSFRNVEILMACESHWNIRFSSREIDRIRTVGDLAACIAARIASNS